MESIKYLKLNEMQAVLAAAKKKSARDYCLITFAFCFGLRSQELSLLKLEDVANGFCDCRRLKGSLHTVQEIMDNEIPGVMPKTALAGWLREREDTGSVFLFTSRLGSGLKRRAIYDIFEDAAFAAGIEPGRRNIHICKHSMCENLKRAGLPVDVVQQRAGHKDPSTTLRYYYHTTQADASEAIRAAFRISA